MFRKIIEFFTGTKSTGNYAHPLDAVTKPAEPQAPNKLEPPVPANEPPRCGCGRSATGFCVGLHKLSPEQWATHSDNPDHVTKVVVADPVKKPRRPAAKKPAETKAPAPKKPRAKKTA